MEIIPSENKRNIDIFATHEIKSFNRFGFSGSRRNIKANTLTNEELKQGKIDMNEQIKISFSFVALVMSRLTQWLSSFYS